MAEQDKVHTGKPDAPASEPAAPEAKAEAGSLSAAAEAAAAKIEASLVASRAAAARKSAPPAPPIPPAPAAKPAAAPAKADSVKPTAAGSSAVKPAAKPTATKPAATKPPAAKDPAAKVAAAPLKPEAKPTAKAEDPEEIEDIIAQIPVEPLPDTTKASSSTTSAPSSASGATAATRALPRTGEGSPGTGTPPQTASAIAAARSRVFGAYTPVPEPTPAARERRAAREAALQSKPPLARTLQVALAICYPFILLVAAIRLIASPIFLWAVYQRPGFPADGYGFSTADRMTYGSYGVDFLNNVADNRYLGELRDPNGNPLFLGTEVQHMADVKNVMSFTYLGAVILAVIAIIALAYLGKRYAGGIRRGLFAGSVVTLVLLAGLTTLAILGWDSFFTTFHEVFFSQGNWTFNYSDTLIRLYPPQFWVDAAITIAGLALITSLLSLVFTWPTARRREIARLRQEKRVFGL